MTGYSRNAIVHHGRLDAGVNLITKPFNLVGLGHVVKSFFGSDVPSEAPAI